MCRQCKDNPRCACKCKFVQDVDLVMTVLVRGIPITRLACKSCGHIKGHRRAHKVRPGRRRAS